MILSTIIENSECQDSSNTNPMLEEIVLLLPPGTIPLTWVLQHTPAMVPRFFSISSIDKNNDEVTITQSAFHFNHNNRAGSTTKYLRLGLQPGDTVDCRLGRTDFHMPSDESAPVIMIASGSGVAPFRSFWTARKKNPMFLFFGCQRESDLPFKTEIDQLENDGRLKLYPAYSRGDDPMYVQDKLSKEGGVIRKLLEHPSTTIYLCGMPSMEISVRESLISIIGGSVVTATLSLARKKVQGRYITEVYGKPVDTSSPMNKLWEESLSKVVHIASSLDRIGVPKDRKVLQEKKLRESKIIRCSYLTGQQSDESKKHRSSRLSLSLHSVKTSSGSVWDSIRAVGASAGELCSLFYFYLFSYQPL